MSAFLSRLLITVGLLLTVGRGGAVVSATSAASAATWASVQRAGRMVRADSVSAAVRVLEQRLAVVRAARLPVDELAIKSFLMSWVAATDLVQSEQYATDVVRLAKQLGHPEELGDGYYQLGNNAHQQQDLARSAALMQQAITSFARFDSLSTSYGGALASLAGTYLELGKAKEARPYFLRGLALARRRQEPLTEFSLLALWGNGLRNTAPDTAVRYLQQALRLAQTKLRREPQGPEAEVYAQLVLMQITHERRQWSQTLTASQQVARGARRIENPEYESEALLTMADALRHLGQGGAGYDTLVRAMVLIDTLRGQTKVRELARQQAALGTVEQQARIRGLEQERRIARLRAEQAQTRWLVVLVVAVVLGLLHFLGLYLYRRLRVSRARLAVSEANASRANATKDRLMRIIGHDLRGPVATFQQALPLVRHYADHPDPAELTSLVDALMGQAKELRNLLDNLLNWSLSQSNEVRNAPIRLAPVEALTTTVNLYQSAAQNKGVTLHVEADPDLPAAWADPALLSAVLRNLVSNALKFTPSGGSVWVRVAAGTGHRLEYSVRDTGVGMTPDQLAHLFDVKLNRSTDGTAGEGGTGLGLLICQHFAGLLGGELTVSSRPGAGTLFRFTVAEDVTGKVASLSAYSTP